MPEDSRLRRWARRRPLLTFSVLAIGLGWIVALPLVVSKAGIGLFDVNVPEEWIMLVATTPTIAALWVQWLSAGNFRISALGRPWWRVLFGAAGAVLLVLLAYTVVPALLLTGGAAGSLHWGAIVTASAGYWINPFNLLGGPLNEEPGWRGFALPRFRLRYGAFPGSVRLATLWIVWHAPLLLVKGWLGIPIWAFIILLLCLTILMTWGASFSGGSIVTAVLMHAVYNSNFPILVGLCRGLPTREPGLAYYVAGAVLTTLIVIGATRGRLGWTGTSPTGDIAGEPG
ncbi:MAG: CPBP family glutamic-type intramembrane protease [Gemmatimonadota bacterium]